MKALYVSPDGNDRWSGSLPEPNARGTDGPFATLPAAARAVRIARRASSGPVTVYLRDGIHRLRRPLRLTHLDSGSLEAIVRQSRYEDASVTWSAYEEERPVVSGGIPVTGWKPTTVNGVDAWVARVPRVLRGRRFRQLWVNGERRIRPVFPDDEFFRIERLARKKKHTGHPWAHGDDRFIYGKGDLDPAWHNLQDVEVRIYNYWVDSRMHIDRIDSRRRCVIFDRPSRQNLLDDRQEGDAPLGACYRVENVFERLSRPGEWYVDRPAGIIYYIPMPGEDIDTIEAIAPVLDRLVLLEGQNLDRKPAAHIRFKGITFAHTEWDLPDGFASSNQAANEVPATVSIRNAHDIRLDACAVTHTGGYGIACTGATRDVEITRCALSDLGAGGVKIWHGCTRSLIADCEIGDGGHIFRAGVGVLVGKSSANRILHNNIHDFYYTGVSLGWCWGYAEGDAYGNVVEYNHIHDIGHGLLSDMGGIYTLSVCPGTRLRYNCIHHIWSRTYGGWGIYPDEGTSHMLIENNLVHHTKDGGFHQHYGRENIVRNNIFAFAHQRQCHRTRLEPHDSFTFESNIVYFDSGDVWTGNWSENNAVIRNNLYFDPGRKVLRFGGATFRQWQKRGLDEGSRIADPVFRDPERGNFELGKSSPAFELGFREFSVETAGPRTPSGPLP